MTIGTTRLVLVALEVKSSDVVPRKNQTRLGSSQTSERRNVITKKLKWALLGTVIAVGWTISGSFSANASQIQPLRPVAGAPPTAKTTTMTTATSKAKGLVHLGATIHKSTATAIRAAAPAAIRVPIATATKTFVQASGLATITRTGTTAFATRDGTITQTQHFAGQTNATTMRDGPTAIHKSTQVNSAIRGAPQVDVTIGSPAPSFISKISAIMTATRDSAASALFFGFTLLLSVTAVTMLTRRRSSLKDVNTPAVMRLWDVDMRRNFGLSALT